MWPRGGAQRPHDGSAQSPSEDRPRAPTKAQSHMVSDELTAGVVSGTPWALDPRATCGAYIANVSCPKVLQAILLQMFVFLKLYKLVHCKCWSY